MRIPAGQICETNVRVACHPSIHPDDMKAAVVASLQRTSISRKKATPEAILEDFFLASIANKRPWSEEQVRTIARLSVSPGFCERFARALDMGRARMFDPIDVFILSNWRTLTDPNFSAVLPGLSDWSPQAACALIEFAGLEPQRGAGGGEWYATRRKRLGLHGKNVYRVRGCYPSGDGKLKIDHD